eukprot:scaffold3010_cov79-Skeletonema_menzelii.AAC.1
MGETAAKEMDGAPRFPARMTPCGRRGFQKLKPATTCPYHSECVTRDRKHTAARHRTRHPPPALHLTISDSDHANTYPIHANSPTPYRYRRDTTPMD